MSDLEISLMRWPWPTEGWCAKEREREREKKKLMN